MAGVVRVGQGASVVGCCEGDSKPAHARPAYAARKFSARACQPLLLFSTYRVTFAQSPFSSRYVMRKIPVLLACVISSSFLPQIALAQKHAKPKLHDYV